MRAGLAALAVTGLTVFSASADSLESLFSASEVQLRHDNGNVTRHEVWRLETDGTFFGSYTNERWITQGGIDFDTGKIKGKWWVENEHLCVDGAALKPPGKNCFQVTRADGAPRRNEFDAINLGTGHRWHMYLYTRRR